MAGGKSHLAEFPRIPRANDMPPAEGIFFYALDKIFNLVDFPAVRRAPIAPLAP